MRLSVFLCLFISAPALAQSLPKRAFVENISLPDLPEGRLMTVKASFEIPKGYKSSYPPSLNVYEKKKGGWQLVNQIQQEKLSFLRTPGTISFSSPIELEHVESPIAFDFSVAFCKVKCVINNFQGQAHRNHHKKDSQVTFKMKGFLPEEKVSPEFKVKKGQG